MNAQARRTRLSSPIVMRAGVMVSMFWYEARAFVSKREYGTSALANKEEKKK